VKRSFCVICELAEVDLRAKNKQKFEFSNQAFRSDQGVDVMITIFCDFRQFSAKNWRFSQNVML
jgi:hypothetical protein